MDDPGHSLERLEPRIAPAVFVVDTLTDDQDDFLGNADGAISLREAITAANTNQPFGDAPAGDATGDRIFFLPALSGGTLTIHNGQFSILDDLQLFGRDSEANVPAGITIDAARGSRIFFIDANQAVTITDLTLLNGRTAANESGGGIHVTSGEDVTLTDVTLRANSTTLSGGGIYNEGTLTINSVALLNHSAIVENSLPVGNGGGVFNNGGIVAIGRTLIARNHAGSGGGVANGGGGTLVVTDSTVDHNTALSGAGISNFDAGSTFKLDASTVSINSTYAQGGGVFLRDGNATITNSTISGNVTTYSGGAGVTILSGSLSVTNSTIVANGLEGSNTPVGDAGGGIRQFGGTVSLLNTIVADNTQMLGTLHWDVSRSGGVLSATNSLIEHVNTGTINGVNTANLFLDPLLGPLQDNGGPTFTHALRIGSPAIDAGAAPMGLVFDQRGEGFPRSPNGAPDIGAYESAAPVLIAVAAGHGSPRVKIFDATTGTRLHGLTAFRKSYTAGVTVATGDVNHDGSPDLIAGKAGRGNRVSVVDMATGAEISSFSPFAAGFNGGVFVAAGDVNGDGFADIIVGKASGGSRVNVFSGKNGSRLLTINPFPSQYRGGVTVAAGDVDGDGLADIVVGRASGAKSDVRVFSGATGAQIASFRAFDSQVRAGVFVAAADVTGDGRAEVIAGAGDGGVPAVHVLNGLTGALLVGPLTDFLAFPGSFSGGVRVAVTDANRDGNPDILVGSGTGMAARATVFDSTTGVEVRTIPLSGLKKGVFVGG